MYGEDGLHDARVNNGETKADKSFVDEMRRVLRKSPPDFGYRRPTWTRELLARVLAERGFAKVSVTTTGRVLAGLRARRGRPKPFVKCPWPAVKREHRLAQLRRLESRSSPAEPVFYVDEVDIHFNPKLGPDWMLPGQQRWVLTPGKNKKHYVAGALHAGTRKLVWVDAPRKTSELFCQLVWRVLTQYRRASRVHFILDNFIIHSSKKTKRFLAQFGDRVVLHFLPPYCPDANRIEREWQDLHANVTRNHRHRTMTKLLLHVFAYLDERSHCATDLACLPALKEAA